MEVIKPDADIIAIVNRILAMNKDVLDMNKFIIEAIVPSNKIVQAAIKFDGSGMDETGKYYTLKA